VKAQISGTKLPFAKGPNHAIDAFAAAATGPGATGLVSEFPVREAAL
jgi:hypothetical protein